MPYLYEPKLDSRSRQKIGLYLEEGEKVEITFLNDTIIDDYHVFVKTESDQVIGPIPKTDLRYVPMKKK